MFVYWLLFAYFAVGVVLQRRDARTVRSHDSLFLVFGAAIIALLIGLRFEVGGDWNAYQLMFSLGRYADLEQMLRYGDPAYQLLNWAVERIGGDIWLVNLVCGAIFAWGLLRFARTQFDPWLVMLVAVPYLIVVVAMGYSRQGVAIGLLLGGLAALVRGSSILKFSIYVFVAALFHKSALVVLLLVLFGAQRNWFLNLVFVAAAGVVLYDSLLAPSVDLLMRNYVDASYNSQGALIRVAMSAVPAAVFFAARKRFAFAPQEDILWRNFASAALLLVILLAVLPSSTVVDRLALYVLPLQLVIVARVPGRLLSDSLGRPLVIFYAFAIEIVWLNYAAHATAWVPYRNYIWS